MAKMVKVLVFPVGKAPEVREIDDSLESMQGIVGGYIEPVSVGNGLTLWCNEEGKVTGLPLNLRGPEDPLFPSDVIAGDFFLARNTSGGGLKSLSDKDIKTFTAKWGETRDVTSLL